MDGRPVLPVAILTAFLAFIATFVLPLSPAFFLRRALALRRVFLACPWRLLLTRGCPLLRLLPLLLDCRGSLLRWGLRGGWPLHVFASFLRRL